MDDLLRNRGREAVEGDIRAEAKLLNERLRAGQISPEDLLLAAVSGNEAAKLLLSGRFVTKIEVDVTGHPGIKVDLIEIYTMIYTMILERKRVLEDEANLREAIERVTREFLAGITPPQDEIGPIVLRVRNRIIPEGSNEV